MTQNKIPAEMTAVILKSYGDLNDLRVERRPVPEPGRKEVLVRVAASAVNPSDLSFLEGNYGFKKPTPVVPGFEGSGTVVAVGSDTGLMGRYLKGKRVACVTQDKGDGLWAEYVTTTVNFALPLDDAVSLEQGAMSVVNPLTAVALVDMARQKGHEAILNTAAASALGQMLVRLGRQEGVRVVNIVRREAQVALLQRQGADAVLNSSAPDFERRLRDTCHEHGVRLAYDAVAGRMTWRLLDAMPRHSRVTIYGGLSEEPAQVLPGHVIFQDKTVDGFWLSAWLADKNFLQLLLLWRRAQKLLTGALKTEIRARYPLEEVRQAVAAYQERMTGGKILLVPGQA